MDTHFVVVLDGKSMQNGIVPLSDTWFHLKKMYRYVLRHF